MSLSVGIVGLPNSGKSTLFNALLSRQIAPVANYPFTTIDPHEGVVPLPDERLAKLAEIIKPEKTTPATVTFIDIAGLVKNAHQGEGMGNQFLGKIREVEAVVQVVRAFENPDVPHYYQTIDPKRDIEIVNLELELGGIKKPTLYVLNVGETQLKNPPAVLTGAIPICAKTEMELIELAPAERKEYLSQLGVNQSGLEKLILAAYQILGLITFYTIKGGQEVRAWTISRGETAQQAAGVVHTDFEKNFIKADVISFEDFVQYGGWENARSLGKIRSEGKDYCIKDGEVIEFKVGV